MKNHQLLLACHGCGHAHTHWPGQLAIDPSLTVYYHCPDLNQDFHHTIGTRHASVAMNTGVSLVGVPDTAETLTR